VTAARIVVRGATTALTRRTTLRKAFLGPWHELVDQCWLYALADAQRHTGMAIHHAVRVVNHHHLTVTPSEPNTGQFLRLLHGDISAAISTLLAHERYDTPCSVFDVRPTHCMRLLDAEAQASHLLYERLNPVAAGLVREPDHMPGLALGFDHWKTGGLAVKRPPLYFSKNRPEELRLELTPPPLLYRCYGGELEKLVYDMVQLERHGTQALKRAFRGRSFLGAQKIRRLHPWSEPVSLAEPKGQSIPRFKRGAADLMGRRQDDEARRESALWHGAYDEALERHDARALRRLQGEVLALQDEIVFHYGTYEMRLRHHVPTAEPDADSLIAAPGPLLAEIREELARDAALRCDARILAERRALRANTELACEAEAEVITQQDVLDFERSSVRVVDVGARPEPELRRRFDRSLPQGPAPRRIITLRDHRRGRPPGSDPPR